MQSLIQAAKDIIDKRYEKGKHSVGAAVKTKSGNIYTGISVNSQKLDLCSEWIAVGKALTYGDTNIEMIVAVHKNKEGNFEIYPPCALCRELYITYCPDAKIIFPGEEVVAARDVLPKAWMKKQK